MQQATLLDPWLLLLAPLALAAGWWRLRVRAAAVPTAALSLFAGITPTLRQRCAWLPLLLRVLAALALTVALARPVVREVVESTAQGIDLVLVVDLSSSMTMEDMSEQQAMSRMAAARQRAEEFALARTADRIGLVTFSRFAELRCPPTLDEQALAAFLRGLDTVPPNSELDGTAIGTGLAKAVAVLQKSKAKSRVVVLLSDGETTVADIKPEDAAKLAADAGVRVHTIGLGQGVPTPFGMQRLGFGDLKQIAEHTGGKFFQPTSDRDLAAVYEAIDALEKTELAEARYRTSDRFELPLLLGLVLLWLALLLDALWLRRTP